MLSAERNSRLTQVDAGTPMGELLRRYWWPIALSADLIAPDLRKVRLLGEDLVLYRLTDGSVHLLEDRCPHRGAALSYGIVEHDGLRCPYHGWLFDGGGTCLAQPGEPEGSTFAHRVRATAYAARELGGLIFAYLGPGPAPILPRYDLFCWEDAIRDIGYAVVPCNFVQIMENAVDLDHVAWLHGRYSEWLAERGRGVRIPATFAKLNREVAFEEFEHGILMRRRLDGQDRGADDWSVGHPLIFPHMLRLGGGGSSHFHLRVPIDNENTRVLWYTAWRPGGLPVPEPGPISSFEVPWRWPDGEFRVDHVEGQDIMAWVTQGRIADRTREHLGAVDRGVILLRRMYFQAMSEVAAGRDPLGVHRGADEIIDIPQEQEKFGSGIDFVRDFLSAAYPRFSPRRAEIARRYAEVGLELGLDLSESGLAEVIS